MYGQLQLSTDSCNVTDEEGATVEGGGLQLPHCSRCPIIKDKSLQLAVLVIFTS